MYRSYLVMHVSLYHGIHDFSALYHCVNSIIALYCCIIALYHCITVSLRCINVQCSAACKHWLFFSFAKITDATELQAKMTDGTYALAKMTAARCQVPSVTKKEATFTPVSCCIGSAPTSHALTWIPNGRPVQKSNFKNSASSVTTSYLNSTLLKPFIMDSKCLL